VIALLFWFANSSQKRTSTLLSVFIIIQELFHLQALSMLISTMHFVGFSFHSCFIMNVDNQDVFMNGVKEDGEGEGFPLFVFDYGVGIGEA
jgi:hypothetical protein